MKRICTLGLIILFSMLAAVSSSRAAGRQVLRGQAPTAVARLQAIERLAGTNRLDLVLGLPLRNQEALTNLLRELYDPGSPSYRHFLTPQQFAERFGPSERDYGAVIAFSRSNGLVVTGVHPNRTLLDVRGSAAQIESAFHVNLRVYQHPTESRVFYAPDAEPSLDLTVPLLTVGGLDNFTVPRPMNLIRSAWEGPGGSLFAGTSRRNGRVTRGFDGSAQGTPYATGSGPRTDFIGTDFRAAYAPGVALDGTGQSVGLFEMDNYYPSDVLAYEELAGLPYVTLTNVFLNGGGGSPGGNNIEVSLDIDMAVSMAPGLDRVIVYEGASANDILNRMATDNLARQLSCSWGFGSQVDSNRTQIYLQYAAQGQTMFQSSGDGGAFIGAIFPPADDPNLTVVGGTSLTTSGPGGTWQAETTWSGSGGGISTAFPIPAWQQSVNMTTNQGSTTMRNIPDVACLADSVMWLIANNEEQAPVGGTSAAAPLWAGFAALANQAAAVGGRASLGFLNPALYAIGSGPGSTASFHDITTGNNTNTISDDKFLAAPGYDLCTGWGTPTGSSLIQELLAPADSLEITPSTNFFAIGTEGSPFTPGSWDLVLTNTGLSAFGWAAALSSDWLDASTNSGTLTPGCPAASLDISLNSSALKLAAGLHAAQVWFTNLNSGFVQSRVFRLEVLSSNGMGSALSVLHQFAGGSDGANPNELIQDANGTLYGTTEHGGTNSVGIVFQLSTNGTPANLYTFTGGDDGANPRARLAQGVDGSFYGTTYDGSTFGNGTVFRLTTNGALTTLFSFEGTNGDLPRTWLVQGGDGSLYGTTCQGGANGHGSVFKVTTNGVLTTLVSFHDDNGGFPTAGLCPGADGNFYGATYKGGAFSSGTVFSITPAGGFSLVASLDGTNAAFPIGGLVQGDDGNFYGVSSVGGAFNHGGVFRVAATGALTNLYSFSGGSDGDRPTATLLRDSGGNFYGSTVLGGTYGLGTLFRMADDGSLTTLAQFHGFDGANPTAALLQGMDGDLYGATQNGDSNGHGVLFRLGMTSAPQITRQPANQIAFLGGSATFGVAVAGAPVLNYQWLQNGTNLVDGAHFAGTLSRFLTIENATTNEAATYSVAVSNLAGIVSSTGASLVVTQSPPLILLQPTNQTATPGATTTFAVTAVGDQPLSYQWQSDGTNLVNGAKVWGAMTGILTLSNVLESENGMYSVVVTNALGLQTSLGASLTVIPPGATGVRLTTLTSFAVSTGGRPNGLTVGADGNLYGTTAGMGASSAGTIIQVMTNGQVTRRFSFGGTNGLHPEAPLVQGLDGFLYGTTVSGGVLGLGNVFRANSDGSEVSNLYSFGGGSDGNAPATALVQGTNGSFYGSTQEGGDFGAGILFEVSASGQFTTLYAFTGDTDGGNLGAPLIVGGDGWLYGTTEQGGVNYNGSVFRMSPDGAVFTNLYSFRGGTDGFNPEGGLFLADDGNMYGTTTSAEYPNKGTIFKISTSGSLQTLHTFDGSADGNYPVAGLIEATDGNFYGTSAYGGANNYGTVFRMSPDGTLTTLIQFDGFDDGSHPESSLVEGPDGNLYGTTQSGGWNGSGTIYRLSAVSAPQITSQPASQRVFVGADVRLAVTVAGMPPLSYQWRVGGTNLADGGNIFGSMARVLSLSDVSLAQSGSYSVVVSNALGFVTSTNALLVVTSSPPYFTLQPANQATLPGTTVNFEVFASGNLPMSYYWRANGVPLSDGGRVSGSATSALTLSGVTASDEALYSVIVSNALGLATSQDAALSVFSNSANGVCLTPTYSFTGGADGGTPNGLAAGLDGNLYGTTQAEGANNAGAAFRVSADGTVTTIYSFVPDGDASVPAAGLASGVDGNLYGSTSFNYGFTLFRLSTNGEFAPLISFFGSPDGANAQAALTLGADGNFYGTTESGGNYYGGTVFQMTPAGMVKTLHSFTGFYDGGLPAAKLALGSGNSFYGTTTTGGGTNGFGTVFRIVGEGLVPLYLFTGGDDGGQPYAGVTLTPDGDLFGAASTGGLFGQGTIFRLATDGTLSTLFSFDGVNGSKPMASLTLGADGNYYGTTSGGGPYGDGTVFRLTPQGALRTLAWFNGDNGANPRAAMVQSPDGTWFGTTVSGGTNNSGVVFRLNVAPMPSLNLAAFRNGGFTLDWSAVPGQKYQLQSTPDLNPAAWTSVGPILTSTNSSLQTSDSTGQSQRRFYRLVLVN